MSSHNLPCLVKFTPRAHREEWPVHGRLATPLGGQDKRVALLPPKSLSARLFLGAMPDSGDARFRRKALSGRGFR